MHRAVGNGPDGPEAQPSPPLSYAQDSIGVQASIGGDAPWPLTRARLRASYGPGRSINIHALFEPA